MSNNPEYTLIKEVTNTYTACPYKWLFEKYKDDCKIFIETGTYLGDSCAAALELGFEKVMTVEEDANMFNRAKANLTSLLTEDHQKKLQMFLGNSRERMPEILAQVNSRALFWIDAHYMDGAPAFVELEYISKHPIKNHVIIVDDIPLYFGNGSELQKAISRINPEYKFTFETFPPRGPGYHMAAHF
jgi:hypothetical protein